MDLGGWLRSLGLGEYEAAFRENAIDLSILPDLTDRDLEKIGVLLGHRRKLLRAITNLETQKASASTVASPAAIDASPRDAAERRQVTVMFSDLFGSTALSAHLDPEDLREVISAYQRCVAETVRKFGGFVARYMGDGVLIYFGYPEAHEDDAERAVRSGLALIDAVATLPAPEPLQLRIGAATGMVVIGDLVGSGEAQEHDIVGETPNLAARLQAIAEPNAVVIAEATRKLLGNLFELRDFGPKELKGIAGPVRVFAVLRASSVESRFEAMHPGGLTDLVGREEESELLLRRWTKAKTGEGQVVLLSGEAGIGKSRLTAALLESVAPEPHTRLRYFCSPQRTDSALYPIISQMERAAGFTHADTAHAKLAKLDALLALTSTSKQDAALFAEMLSLPNDDRYPALELTPQRRRKRTLEALTAQIEVLSRQNPVLMIFEDAHWGDPTSLEVFGRSVDRIATLNVLLIVTYRPEFAPPWIGQPHVTTLTINRLTRREADAMIDQVIGNKLLTARVRQDIVERTDGIPLFVEEMTKAVVEVEDQSAAERTTAAIPSPALAVPATLHASLMARLDRLGGPAKEVAQVGATIGREHSHALLAFVTRKPDAELEAALDRLVAAGLLFRQGLPPHATYLFKHALVRDVAYGSLLRGQRQPLHGRIADVLAEHFPITVEAEPEVLAHHYREAGMADVASTYFEGAGDRAVARSAYIEATAHFRAAIEEADRLPQKDERARRALTLLLKLGPAIVLTIGQFKPEVEAVFRRAREGREVGDGPKLFRATWGLWHSTSLTDNKQSRKWTEELTSLAQRLGDDSLLLEAQHCRWGDEFYGGNVPQLLETSENGIRRYDAKRHAQLADAFGGHDPGVCALCCQAMGLSLRGLPDQARRTAERTIVLAGSLSHPPSIAFGHRWVAFSFLIVRDRHGCERMGARTAAIAEKFDLPYFRWGGRYLMGWGKAQGLTLSEGLALMEEAFPPIVNEQHYKWLAAALAEARFDGGRVTDALALVDHALNIGGGPASGLYVPEIHRLRGVFLNSLGSPAEEVERALSTALEIADEQGAFLLKLRAAMSLARLWRDQGKPLQARELLAPVYGWFTEGFDTLDLKEAKALLDELAS
ncbi:MAG: AAA family ATPase [Bradyrhizobium sp.]|nr:AAA family ATPase [Bradyrhizobium sp.]